MSLAPVLALPADLQRLVHLTIANPRATPDHALLLAEALDELANETESRRRVPIFRAAANAVRDFAPALKKS